MVSYAHSGAKLITMLLRISAKVPYPYVLITEPERAALLALLQAARDSRTSEDSLWEAVVAVVMAILRAAVDPSGSNPAAPLVHYVMISNLKRDGSFTEPAGITSPVAGLEWWLRAAFFHWATHEALKQSKPTYEYAYLLRQLLTLNSISGSYGRIIISSVTENPMPSLACTTYRPLRRHTPEACTPSQPRDLQTESCGLRGSLSHSLPSCSMLVRCRSGSGSS